jgi:hypothetical protein
MGTLSARAWTAPRGSRPDGCIKRRTADADHFDQDSGDVDVGAGGTQVALQNEPAAGWDPTPPRRTRMTLVDAPHASRDRDAAPEVQRVDPLRHREQVVRRLLDLGISAGTLRTILPEFRGLIDHVAPRG